VSQRKAFAGKPRPTWKYGMNGLNLSSFPTLTTERLILREVVAEDADDLLAFRGDPEVQQYNLVPIHDTREALSLVRTMQGWYVSRYAIQWGITLRDDDRVLGLCGLHDWNRTHRRASVGYDLVRSRWGQGIASEAVRAVLRYGFEVLDLNRVEAFTIAENLRSIRLLERLGFTLNGPRREVAFGGGHRFREGVVYSLLRSDDAQ
jgi:[ribosomal protein S5]-alanine N-acetyltransferase